MNLKPCPFCGGGVDIVATYETVERGQCFKFVCNGGSPCLGSGLVTVFFGADAESAAEAWNTRPEFKWETPEEVCDYSFDLEPYERGAFFSGFRSAREMKESNSAEEKANNPK